MLGLVAVMHGRRRRRLFTEAGLGGDRCRRRENLLELLEDGAATVAHCLGRCAARPYAFDERGHLADGARCDRVGQEQRHCVRDGLWVAVERRERGVAREHPREREEADQRRVARRGDRRQIELPPTTTQGRASRASTMWDQAVAGAHAEMGC